MRLAGIRTPDFTFAGFFRHRALADGTYVVTNAQGDYVLLSPEEFRAFVEGTVARDSVLYTRLRDGNFLRAWGEGLFPRAHGLHMAPDGTVFLTDDGDHSVRQCTLDGKVLLTVGTPGKPAKFMSGEAFHRCTHTALSPSGDIYVSDGYGNARVHKYAPDGRLIMSWGKSGVAPGEFNLPHSVVVDDQENVYVADRENKRIQIFDADGKFLREWNGIG